MSIFVFPKDIIFLFNPASAINCLKLLLSSDFFANSDDKHYYIVFKSVGVHQTLNTFDKYIESLDTNIESDCSQHDYPLWYVQCFFRFGLTIFFSGLPSIGLHSLKKNLRLQSFLSLRHN